jgi:hypothetical protein
MENGAWFGAGSRNWSYRGREIGKRNREHCCAYGREIVAVWFGAWTGDLEGGEP